MEGWSFGLSQDNFTSGDFLISIKEVRRVDAQVRRASLAGDDFQITRAIFEHQAPGELLQALEYYV
jgi:hypothetical protein